MITFITDNYIIDPLGIAYLSSYLKQTGHEVDIVKTDCENITDRLNQYQPDMLCYSVTTGKHKKYQKLNMEIQGDRYSLFGGPHCTFFPQFAKEPGVDAIVMGEGFDAIVDIANTLENHEYTVGKIAIETIPNIATTVSKNDLRPLKDKNSLLYPDRELIYKYPENYNNPIKNVMCSFGCMMSCPYCYAKKYRELYGLRGVELRSIDNVMGEIETLQQYPLKMIYFQDDIFPIWQQQWLNDFCRQYPKIPFHIQIRIEMLSEEILEQLKESGLYSLTFAIESGNEEYRKKILKRNISNDVILAKAELLHQKQIKFRSENIIGLPGETFEMMMETIDLNQRVNPIYAWASIFHAYPGTALTQEYCIDTDADFFHSKVALQFDRLQKIFAFAVKKKMTVQVIRQLIYNDFQEIHDLFKQAGYQDLYGM